MKRNDLTDDEVAQLEACYDILVKRRRDLWDAISKKREEYEARIGALTDAERGRIAAYTQVLYWMGDR
jgi:hypothetical protein